MDQKLSTSVCNSQTMQNISDRYTFSYIIFSLTNDVEYRVSGIFIVLLMLRQ